MLAKEENKTRLDRFWMEIYQQYGDVVRIKLPGKNMLFLFNPEDHKVMHRNEPRIPYMPEFDLFSYIREEKLKAEERVGKRGPVASRRPVAEQLISW